MPVTIPVTALFIGIFAVIQVPLTVMVGFKRLQTNIQFMDGGDATLLRRMRAHANYTETVPIVLLAMAASEISGLTPAALWAGGASLLIGRLLHARILITKGWGHTRAIGMILTMLPMIGFGAWLVVRAAG